MTPEQRRTLVARYQHQLDATATTAGEIAAQAWDQLDAWDEADIEAFIKLVEPAAAAQAHGSALAAAFVALAAGIPVPAVDTSTATPDWRAAFSLYWAELAKGTPWDEAHAAGRSQAQAVGYDSVQSAARETTTAVDNATPALTQWQRIPDSGACSWCEEVAQQTFHSADSADFGHDRCGCTVAPA